MASARERVIESLRVLDPHGTGAVPLALFEGVMRDVCQESPAWLESLDFALARVDSAEVDKEELSSSSGSSASARGVRARSRRPSSSRSPRAPLPYSSR